jgi:hypothetical protein
MRGVTAFCHIENLIMRYFGNGGGRRHAQADYIALIVLLSLIGVAQLSRNASQRGCARPQNGATIIETITPITIKALVQSIFGRNSAIHCHRGLGLLIVAHLNNRWRLVSLVMFNGLVNAPNPPRPHA